MPTSKSLQLVFNSLTNLSGYAIAVVLGLVSYPIIIHTIGIDAVGIYALIMALLAPLDLTNLGFAEANVRFVAEYASKDDLEKVKQYIGTTLVMSVFVGLVGMVVICLVGPPLAYAFFDFKSETLETIRLCFIMAGVGWLVRQLTAVYLSVPSALQRFKLVALGNSMASIISTICILTLIYFYDNLIGYTLGTLIGAFLSLLFWFGLNLYHFRPLVSSVGFNKEVWKSSFRYGGWQTLSNLGGLITNQTDKYFIGAYLPAVASGVYNVILQIQQRMLSAIWKMAEVLFPMFSASTGSEPSSKFTGLIRSNYLLSAIGVTCFMPFIVLARPTLEIWIDKDFASQGEMVMRCLLMVGIFAAITVVQSFFLMGNSQVRQSTLISYFTGICTAVGAFVLIPLYGLNGAGYGILFAAIARLLLFHVIMKRFLKESFQHGAYLIATLLPLVAGLAVLVLFTYFPIFQPTHLAMLALDLVILALLMLSAIWLFNALVPRARRHNHEVISLLREMRGVAKNPNNA